jgi:hypothetical protein
MPEATKPSRYSVLAEVKQDVFLLQVHAPLPEAVINRVLMLFVCVNDSCCTGKNAFTAWRCQLRQESQPEQPRSVQETPVPHNFGTVTWGAASPAAEASKSSGAQVAQSDFSDLLSQMDDLAVQPEPATGPSRTPAGPRRDSAGQCGRPRRDGCLRALGPELPGFKVEFENMSMVRKAAGLDDRHIQMLLHQYEQEMEAALSEDDVSVGAESYEETDAMTQFVEDLSEVPSQCSRCVLSFASIH